MKLASHRGLPDLVPSKENVGFVLSAGKKGPSGNPVDTDRFHILTPGSKNDARDHHPEFRAYNKLTPDNRRFFHGQIAYARPEEFFAPGYYSQKGPVAHAGCEANPKHQGPWCHGNGDVASRWRLTDPESGNALGTEARPGAYVEIPCPGESCPFRQEFDTGRKYRDKPVMWTPCGRGMRIYFKPRWRSEDEATWPVYTGKLKTYSRRAVASFVGMCWRVYHEPGATEVLGVRLDEEFLAEQSDDQGGLVQQLGIEEFSWLGMPFVSTLGERKTTRGRATDILFTEDRDLIDWLQSQQARLQQIGATIQPFLLGAASDVELSAEQQRLDHETITVVPALARPSGEAVAVDAEEAPAAEPEATAKGDPRAHVDRIRDDWVGKGKPLSSAKANKALLDAKLLSRGQTWRDIGDERSWEETEKALDGALE